MKISNEYAFLIEQVWRAKFGNSNKTVERAYAELAAFERKHPKQVEIRKELERLNDND